ncbi:hypothetical protein [Halopelagius fulvigenes]|uniref:N-acetyltransferase domain-containing protein n=1 Tax=Halopelagius fulvigenes TaxID=1198324 RepID=A0ABD5U6B1_9EURY
MDADVRDAVEADAPELAAIADSPVDVMRNVVHDRTVRVAEQKQGGSDPNVDTDTESGDSSLLGFVSFDVSGRTVHITQLGGSVEACERLLGEPVRFAAREGMTVEFVVSESDDDVREAVENAGFTAEGPGPQFDGGPTVRYSLDPN